MAQQHRVASIGHMVTRTTRTVRDVMHRGVVLCTPEMAGTKVAKTMTAHRIHSVVVVAAADLPRLITDVDIASALYAGTLDSVRAADLASWAPLVRLSDPVEDVLARMHEAGSTHAVAVDRLYRPLGVISVLDVVEATLESLRVSTDGPP
jgi:CBS domain-containing protein